MTKDIEDLNTKWDTKVLGKTKAYEKDKRFLGTEKEWRKTFHQTPSPLTTTANDANKNLESTNSQCLNSLSKNWQNTKKLGSPTNKTSREKIQPNIINLSKRHFTKFQISLLTKEPKFCPTAKGNVFDIKSDTKKITRKLKLR